MSHLISPSKLTGGKKLILWLFWLKVFLEEQKSNFANSSMPGFLTDRFSAVITSFRGSTAWNPSLLHYCVSPLILELNISETSECANISAAVARCEGLTRVRAVFVRQLIGPPPRMWLLTKQSYPTPVVLTGCATLSSENGLLPQ